MARSKSVAPLGPHDIKSPVFEGVAPEVLERMLAQSEVRRYAAGELILSEGDDGHTFCFLHSGSVRVFYRSPDAVEIVVKLFRAPAAWGDEAIAGTRQLASAQALETCVVLNVPRPVLLEAIASSHPLAMNLLRDATARLCICFQNERSLAFNPLETRLANLLSCYVDFYGLPAEDGILIRIPLTQDDLANALGAVRRSIARVLGDWMERGILSKRQGHFVVHDTKFLSSAVDPDLLQIAYHLGAQLEPKG